MSRELDIAVKAANAAAEISRRYYRGNLTVTIKDDQTPVTQADVECEQAIYGIIAEEFPDDGFLGEETGQTGSGAARTWLVDPIDGTKAFIRQYPFFSTQIALMENDEIALGVSCGTMFDELGTAERGQGSFLNGERLQVSEVSTLSEATVSSGNLASLAASDGWPALGEIIAGANRIRGYGDFYHYHLLAGGKIDVVVESDVNILDIAALSLLVTEAGGVFTDLNGNPPSLTTRSVLAANPALHAELLKSLGGFVP